MQFFLDTASINDIQTWKSLGVVQGVTTNPTLLSKEGVNPIEQLMKITEIVEGPVSAQVTYDTHEKMIIQGRALAKLADNIVVKVPATREGYLAAKVFVNENIKCNITLSFDPAQAIPFCMIPATYISYIVGRVEDFGLHSLQRVKEVREILDLLKSSTKFLAASIRNSHHLIASVLANADAITIPPTTWTNIYQNPLTLGGEQDFFSAWKKLPETLREKYEKIS